MKRALVSGPRALEETARLWDDLAARVEPVPFLRRAWARAWLEHLADGHEPWILLLGDPPQALLPLARRRAGPLRTLTFLGHGHSDYMGPLTALPDAAIAPHLARALHEHRHHYDLLLLRGLTAPEYVAPGFAAALHGAAASRVYERCPRIRSEGSWEDYLGRRKKRFRANLKRTSRRVEALGDAVVAIEPASEALFAEMVEVERNSWKWEHGLSSLRLPATREFVRSVLLADALPLEAWTLRVDRSLAAFAIVLRGPRTRYYYLPSFHSAYPDAGSYLLGEIVRASFASEVAVFDFLQGDEAYKLVWADDEGAAYELAAAGRARGYLPLAGVRSRWRLARSQRLQRVWLDARVRLRRLTAS